MTNISDSFTLSERSAVADAEIAALFDRATGNARRTYRKSLSRGFGDIEIRHDGSLSCKQARSPEILRAEAIQRLRLETARRLRARDDDASEFNAWASEARFVLNDPEVIAGFEAAAMADVAFADTRNRLYALPRSYHGEVDPVRDEAVEAWNQARKAQSEAAARAKNAEKTARDRFKAEAVR